MIDDRTPRPDAGNDEFARLVRSLHETHRRIQELTDGKVDAVMDPSSGETYLLPKSQADLRLAEAEQRRFAAERAAVLDALPAHIALLDRDGRIVAVNEAWRRFAAANAFSGVDFAVGSNYLEVCDLARGDCSDEARAVAAGIRSVLRGETATFAVEYPCHSPNERRWFRLMATPVERDRATGAVAMHIDITERKRDEILREAEARILESISSSAPLPAVLNDIALAIEEAVPDAKASILLLDPDGKRLRFGAAPNLPDAFNRAVDGLAVDPVSNACGVCGTAAHRRRPVIVTDVATDPLCEGFRDLAREHGIGACWSMPVMDRAGNVSATFAVYFPEPRIPQESDLAPFARMAHLVGIAVERNRDAEALRASEERFRGTFRDAAIGMVIIAIGGRFLEANEAYCRMLGYPLEELRATDFQSLTYPEDLPADMAFVGELLAGKRRGYVIEKRYLTKSGGIVWCRLSVSANWDAAGNPINLVAVAEDITERKRAGEELRQKESLLRIAGKIARMAGWTVDARDRRVAWTDELRVILDIPPGASPSVEAGLALYMSDSRERMAAALDACLRDGTPFDLELEARTAKQRHIWVRVRGEAVRDDSGAILRAQGAIQDITEQKLAGDARRASEERFRQLAEAIEDVFWMTDPDKNLMIYVSPAYERIWGCPIPDLYRNPRLWLEAIHDEDRPRIVAALPGQAEGRYNAEYRIVRPDGTIRWIVDRAYPVRDESGRVYRIAGTARDITQRKLAERAVVESEERFRLLSKATNDAIWDWNLVTDALWWNEGFETLFGFKRDEVEPTSESWTNRIHPEDTERIVSEVHRAIEGGTEYWSGEYRFLRKDGAYAYVLDRGHIIRDPAGKPVRMIGGMTDLTERKRAEERLADQAALLDVAQDAIIVRDLDHRIQFWNKSAERMYGWTAQEAVGRSIEDLLYEDPTEFRRVTAVALAEGKWAGRVEQRRKDGTRIVVEGNWTLVRDSKGNPRAILAVNTDMTDRLVLEEQLRQSQKLEAVGQLTGGIAHDFNNHLTVILGSAELLVEFLEGNEKLRRLARTAQTAAQRGAELTQRLLAFSRRQALEPQAVDVNRLLAGMDGLMRRTLTESISIELSPGDGLWDASIDPSQLENAILNLCINARDAMKDGGKLTIETANVELDGNYADSHTEVVPGKYVMIAVTDTGTGIPPDVIGKVFDPFFTTKEQGKGTGLGLSMVYGFVKQSGGHVKIYSEVGQGTTVKLYLPRAVGLDKEEKEKPAADSTMGGSETILMVEDDDLVRAHVEGQLRALGYRVLAAGSGPEALDIFRKEPRIDLLFTDVIMPGGMNGKELADAVRQIRPGTKVLFTSGYTENAIVHQGRLDRGVLLLSKPYRRADLARMIRVALGQDKEPPS